MKVGTMERLHVACGTCDMEFALVAHLKRHKIFHIGNEFGGTNCDKTFSRIVHLKSHQRW